MADIGNLMTGAAIMRSLKMINPKVIMMVLFALIIGIGMGITDVKREYRLIIFGLYSFYCIFYALI